MSVFKGAAFRFACCFSLGVAAVHIPVDEAFEQDDSCLDDNCAVNLLQRKAVIRTPDGTDSRADAAIFADTIRRKQATTTTSTTYSCSQESENPYTVQGTGFRVIVNDPLYISMLQNVTTFGGTSLYDQTKCVTWPGLLLNGEAYTYWTDHFESDFPNTALYIWGSNSSDKLFVYAPGTNAVCTQYADILAGAAQLGYLVICPQLSGGPSAQESLMKPAIAVEWALSFRSFSSIMLGGHSGGASVIPATARLLLNKNISIDGMVMQHPGVVGYMNIPGCAMLASKLLKEGQMSYASDVYYCEQYFPVDLLQQVASVRMVVIAGSFCQWSKVQNSNWLSNYACGGYGNACAHGQTFPTPSDRPEQPPVTCPVDQGCPDVNFLANPGDCMFECDATSMHTVYVEPLLDDAQADVTLLQGCTDHGYGVVGPNGFKESAHLILPFLNDTAEGYLQMIQSWNGTDVTCKSWYNLHEQCLFPITPFTTEFTDIFADAAGTIYPCNESVEMTASGKARAFNKPPMS